MNDSWQHGIGGLRAAYANDTLSPADLVDMHYRRIEVNDARLKSYIQLCRVEAMAAARASEQRYREDRQLPLDGVPVAIKANIAVGGLELNAGMAARKGMIAPADAPIVAQLREAGAIILGTLNMHEAALGATTDNPYFGRAINPHGEGRSPGGSSGGAGAAVAAGLAVAALGTDTLGSIRIPAAWCGVYGLKPSNVAPCEGMVPLSPQMDAIGPIARSMEDLSYLTNILFKPDLSSAMQRSRFLVLADLGGVEADPAVIAAYKFALEQLAPEQPSEIRLDSDCGRIRLAGFAQAVRDLIPELVDLGPERCDDLSPEVAKMIEFALNRSDHDLGQDDWILQETKLDLRRAIGANGVLITPTTPHTAHMQGEQSPSNTADWTALANIAGLPALTLPIARDSNDLPIGLQMIGPPGGEALLVAQARMINDRIKGYSPPPAYW